MMAIRLVMILVLFLAGGFHIWQKRKNQFNNEEFDERQRFLIGQSYKYAAGSSWILIVLLSLTNAVYPDLLSISFILACLLFLPLTVFGVSNILNDAYYPVKSSGKWKRLSPQRVLLFLESSRSFHYSSSLMVVVMLVSFKKVEMETFLFYYLHRLVWPQHFPISC